MMVPLTRATLMIIGCTGLVACSQPATQAVVVQAVVAQAVLAQAGGSDAPARVMPSRARLCIAEGQPPVSRADPDRAPWSITVSNEGGPCSHVRNLGRAEREYALVQPPRHGRITQEPRAGETVVSYWPDRGYIGSDSFALGEPSGQAALPYLVAVVP